MNSRTGLLALWVLFSTWAVPRTLHWGQTRAQEPKDRDGMWRDGSISSFRARSRSVCMTCPSRRTWKAANNFALWWYSSPSAARATSGQTVRVRAPLIFLWFWNDCTITGAFESTRSIKFKVAVGKQGSILFLMILLRKYPKAIILKSYVAFLFSFSYPVFTELRFCCAKIVNHVFSA